MRSVEVRIVKREAPFHAVIDVRGQRLRAHFPDGVPGNDLLKLSRTGTGPDSTVFRIITDSRDHLKPSPGMADILLLKNPHIAKDPVLLLNSGSLIDLFMPGPGRKKFMDRPRTADIMNRLLSAGLSRETISDLIRLLPGGDITSILLALSGEGPKKKNPSADLFSDLEKFLKENRNHDLLTDLIFLFANNQKVITDSAFFDTDNFVPTRVATGNDLLIVSLTLSFLGQLDIIGFKDKEHMHCSIICDNRDSVHLLKKRSPDLSLKLKEAGIKADISIEERKIFLIELNERAHIIFHERGINVRV